MSATESLRTQFTVDVTDLPEQDRASLANLIQSFFAKTDARPTMPDVPDSDEPTLWTQALYERVLQELAASRAYVQIAAIKRAIENGGSVSRAEVYELGSYEASRSLKGFTRPVNRIVNALIEAGTLPEEAEELLTTDYDEDVTGYQRAKGFVVPPEVVRLARG